MWEAGMRQTDSKTAYKSVGKTGHTGSHEINCSDKHKAGDTIPVAKNNKQCVINKKNVATYQSYKETKIRREHILDTRF